MKPFIIFLALSSFFLISCRSQPGIAEAKAPYRDPSLPVQERVSDLLSRMTVREKIGQMMQVARDYIYDQRDISSYGFGSILSGGGSTPAVNTPEAWADMIDGYQKKALESRLGIPMIYGIDAVHGHNNVRGAVVFPHNIGMGAANDVELSTQEGRITALEMLATGARWDFAPCITVPRDERWGRTYEGFGETPLLSGPLGAAEIKGLQEGGLGSPMAVLATAKHFAGDGGTSLGIDRGNAQYDDKDFRSLHVAPYVDAIAAGAESVMVSYSSWNGVKNHGNEKLLNGILRGELGFSGFVVSDWGGLKELPGSSREQIRQGINAGIDMVMIPDTYRAFFSDMMDLTEKGEISVARVDEAVGRILRIKFEMGLFERPFADRGLLPSVGSAEHRAVARKAVAESLVLLKNRNGALPIGPSTKNILVVGYKADDMGVQCGGWTITWQGGKGAITEGTTIFKGIKDAAGPGVRVELSLDGSAPAGFAPDAVIAVVGEEPYAEMYGDRKDLSLGSVDERNLDRAARYGKPVTVILISGRPMIVTEEFGKADAFVAAWLPGTEGEGVADVLFGKRAFSGKLPCTWPASMDQVPINSGDGKKGLFDFGYGLAY
ncbi:MAG: glycoside hydrolase family 3 N-terminal domain-containing protein [Spirochaetia bacterium]|jgi:beta-glucosidase